MSLCKPNPVKRLPSDLPNEIDLLRSLIRFPTVNPPGNERGCIEFIAELLEDYGVKTEMVAQHPDRPNLMAHIPGRGEAPPLLLYGHVDVVPVDDQTWSVPPFDAVLKDGMLWGRGALDMKGGVTILLLAFLSCLENTPPGDVVLAILVDEETGGAAGAEFLAQNHPQFFTGVRHAIGEFGGFTLHLGKHRFCPIQVAEKRYCRLEITFTGPGGHASIPPKGTSISKAARFLAALERSPLPVKISPAAKAMLSHLSVGLPAGLPRLLFTLLANPLSAPFALKLMGAKARMFEPLVRSMITPTVIRAGGKHNVVPERVVVECDVRLTPGQTVEEMEDHLRDLLKDEGTIAIRASTPARGDLDLSQFPLLAEVAKETDPSATPIPLLLPGVTDARHFNLLGIQTYGFLPMLLPGDINFMSLIHAADEHIPVKMLAGGARAVASFIARYRG
jgi:acetylornithine deacetylase/succinyl-diaminopimelate desuccinylase-like protein